MRQPRLVDAGTTQYRLKVAGKTPRAGGEHRCLAGGVEAASGPEAGGDETRTMNAPETSIEADLERLLSRLDTPERRAGLLDRIAREWLPRDHHSVFWGDRMMSLDKVMGFFEDLAFAAAWERVRGAHLYDQYDDRQSIAWRMHTLVWAARHALALPDGDFVECGVFQGDMSLVVYHAASLSGSGRRMHLFDSFEGIDPARVLPGEYGTAADYVAQANAHYGRPGLHESVVARFAPFPEVSVHKGYLPEALEGRAPERIAWLHIDLNAAAPEVETLDALFDRVVPGGMIILDDYGWLVLRAQKDAEDRFFAARGYSVLELPTGQGLVVKRGEIGEPEETRARETSMLDVSPAIPAELPAAYADIFSGIRPWRGLAPAGVSVDFLGTRTDHRYLPLMQFPAEERGDREIVTHPPAIEDGELWFEAANWVMAAREARGHFVMVTLGANYGAQAVGAAKALQAVNPLPCKLVAVEPVPENYARTLDFMRENGIDPEAHWLIGSAIGDSNAPVLFPIGSAGSGAQNCFSTNQPAARADYVRQLVDQGRSEAALRNLLVDNTTGILTNLVAGHDLPAEIKLVSAVTLADVLAPFEIVDYLEADIQQSEILVFPPFVGLLRRKVRRIHIGTHGADTHRTLRDLFRDEGWRIVFDFAPNSRFETPLGRFETNDGVLTVANPDLSPDGA